MGDFSQRQQMKHIDPAKGKSMRRLFTKMGYRVLLIDEYMTSQTMYGFENQKMETFKVCKNPRPFKKGKTIRHGLLRSKSVTKLTSDKTQLVHTLFNRNCLGALNILQKGINILHGGRTPQLERPEKEDKNKLKKTN
jgi:hypothetical protein